MAIRKQLVQVQPKKIEMWQWQPPPLHPGVVTMAKHKLQLEDLSQTCRRDHYCVRCVHAFCSHCCDDHHFVPLGSHIVIPIAGVDAATGKPVIPAHYPRRPDLPITDFVIGLITANDFAEEHPRDAYCMYCFIAFSTALCHHHHTCAADCVLRIVRSHDGRHCVRCTGDEPWFPYMESVLGDPVAVEEEEGDDGEVVAVLLLLPVLRRSSPTACVHCGGEVPKHMRRSVLCSPACDAAHQLEVAQRRERRDAVLAARRLAKLNIHAV
uniref:Uncharacterized protein n=2 Tax=Oryza TaxID=4527 RepID=A0A0D3ELX0_9ORYZ